MKPGWKTTEFWLTILTALPSLAVTAGFVPTSDKSLLDGAAAKIVAGVLAAVTVGRYIHSRALVKSTTPLLVVLTTLLLPGLLVAQQPAVQQTCMLPWRQRIEDKLDRQQRDRDRAPQQRDDPELRPLLQQLLRQNEQIITLLQQRHNTPPMPQYIVLGPQQQLPLQPIPLGGPPRQDLPLGGAPKQEIPLGGPPKQEVPLGPPPRQEVPLGPPPRQQIPLGESKPPPEQKPMPGATISYQRYSRWLTR